jgi:hypothetical protein
MIEARGEASISDSQIAAHSSDFVYVLKTLVTLSMILTEASQYCRQRNNCYNTLLHDLLSAKKPVHLGAAAGRGTIIVY